MGTIKQETLFENKDLRDKLGQYIDVLDKVKLVIMLPDKTHITTNMIADYYEVSEEVINMTVKRHRDELESDGMQLYTGEKLVYIKYTCKMKSNKARRMMLFNRRCVLRIGMLLRDSKIAKEVRTYLLNIEEKSSHEQKIKAVRSSKWDGKDLILYDFIQNEINNNGTLKNACKKAAPILNESPESCQTRYSQHIKKIIKNEELIKKIESNRGRRHLKLLPKLDHREDHRDEILDGIHRIENFIQNIKGTQLETQEMIDLKNQVVQIEKKYSKLLNEHKLLQTRYKNVINSLEDTINNQIENEYQPIRYKINKQGSLEFK